MPGEPATKQDLQNVEANLRAAIAGALTASEESLRAAIAGSVAASEESLRAAIAESQDQLKEFSRDLQTEVLKAIYEIVESATAHGALERYDIGITERFAALENRLLRLRTAESPARNRRLAPPSDQFQLDPLLRRVQPVMRKLRICPACTGSPPPSGRGVCHRRSRRIFSCEPP